MNTLLHPSYFPSVSTYVAFLKADNVVFEAEDNYQKQTNRNRMYIYGPNGKQLLTVPVKHSSKESQLYKDVKIEYDFEWQKNHFKSLETAYRMSPFFEFFEHDLLPIFEKKHVFLYDMNIEIFELVNACLGITIPFTKTEEYFHSLLNTNDLRNLVDGKKDTFTGERYIQVFEEKQGFINNLSILDLLFCEGRIAKDYLLAQQL